MERQHRLGDQRGLEKDFLEPATPAPEAYVDRATLARLMGVSVATIDRMVAAGMPSETWGRRTRRFRPSVAMAWASAQRAA